MAEPVSPKKKASGASPVPGCYIMLLLATLVLGVAVWGGWTFLQQAKTLSAFTDKAPETLPAVVPTPEQVAALEARLAAFKAETERAGSSTFVATLEDVQVLFGGFQAFKEVRPTLVWQEIDAENRLVARISFPMNSLPGQRVYLNGLLYCHLGAHPEAGLYVSTVDIQVPGKTVPPGFLDIYQKGIVPGKSFGFIDDMLMRNLRAEQPIGSILRRVDKVTVEGGKITVTTKAKPTTGGSGW